MSEIPFVTTVRVRYHETDPQRIVFNSRYLEYADESMAEYFRHHGWSYPELLDLGFDPAVVKSTLDYARPAHLDDLIDIQVKCTRVGRSSFTLNFTLSVEGTFIGRIENIYVNVEPDSGTSRPIPGPIALKIRPTVPHV